MMGYQRVRLLLSEQEAEHQTNWLDWWISRGRLIEYLHSQGRCFDLLPSPTLVYDKDKHDWCVQYARSLQEAGLNAAAAPEIFSAPVVYDARQWFEVKD